MEAAVIGDAISTPQGLDDMVGSGGNGGSVPLRVVVGIQQMYARQSHCIDAGDGEGWADTFTADGEFHSPSYDRPYRGRGDLVSFGNAFVPPGMRSQVLRHVISNIVVENGATASQFRATAYLQIVASDGQGTRILRMTVIKDEIVEEKGALRVVVRRVFPDADHLGSS